MKPRSTLFSIRLFVLIACLSFTQFGANAQCAWYVQDVNPWNQIYNITAMNNVYGAGNWQQGTYSTSPATIFSPTTCMVFLEGSDQNAISMNTFLTANITTIENWVNGGGRLFMNAAPNQGGNINYGFSGTVLTYPPSYYTTADAVSPTNPIFLGPYLPTATTYTGTAFAHAYIAGTGLTDLINGTVGYAVHPVCSQKLWGTGIAFFGSMTQPYFWSPQPQGNNLWYNIIYYVANIQLTSLTSTIPLNSYCGGQTFTMSYASSGLTFNAGNQFNVELSDAAGSFATPTVIGNITSASLNGTISCTIPAATPTGTGYRIRTVSTNPVFTGANNGTDITITTPTYPTINITANPGTAVCTNTAVTFTATTTGGGPTPSIQWFVNNNPVGSNSTTYTTNSLQNGDLVYAVLSSSATCATPVTQPSNSLTMTVANPSVFSGMVYATPSDTVCSGTQVIFHTLLGNGGPTPTYAWTKNGNPVGGNTPTYTDNTLANGDQVACTITSSAACVTPPTLTSNIMTTKLITSGHLAGNTNYPTLRQVTMANYVYQIDDAECNLIATIDPQGASPIHGNTTASVTLSISENTFNGQPYVKRHWDIRPDSADDVATAVITINAYQTEFNSYNYLANGWGFPLLPTDTNDVANIPNVRITQFHGAGNVPANYPGPEVVITPTSVVWDTTYHWWNITFPVTGFSGFYIHTVNMDNPLRVASVNSKDFNMQAYPNPAKNVVAVTVTGTRNGDSYLSLTDATGKLIQKVAVTDATTQLNVENLASGIYLIKYNDDKRSETIRITKQ
jgi:hypothetical protein